MAANGNQDGAEHVYMACEPQRDCQKAALPQLFKSGPLGPPTGSGGPPPMHKACARRDNPLGHEHEVWPSRLTHVKVIAW